MGFSRQGYRSELPCPPPGGLPDPGTEPRSLKSPALAGRFLTPGATWEAPGGSDGKASACNVGDPVSILGQEDALEKEMATHSSTLAWKIPWMWAIVHGLAKTWTQLSNRTELILSSQKSFLISLAPAVDLPVQV